MSQVITQDAAQKRATFFRFLFEQRPGYVRIARIDRKEKDEGNKKAYVEEFFKWPDQEAKMHEYILQHVLSHDLYFAPMLFDRGRASKETVFWTPVAWADLDACSPDRLLVPATLVLESSPNRYQALWKFTEPIDAADAEDVSRRVAYYHASEGADKSGWDLTQLLRIPLTMNHKYSTPSAPPVPVQILSVAERESLTLADFECYPSAAGYENLTQDLPTELPAVEDVFAKHKYELHPNVFVLFNITPEDDWSKALWSLELLLFESGLVPAEVFAVVREAKCNKYARDGRSDKLLWREVLKAAAFVTERSGFIPDFTTKSIEPLLTDEERNEAESDRTFVEEYVEWAKLLGDAAPQYHLAGAFVTLSSLLAGTVQLPTSFGLVVPNLWFMILADTTLTRKTTAMDLCIELLMEVDSDVILATDGSIEGLFTSLSMRPGRPSIFLRDEFSGLLESLSKKDYYAGMSETLTKLYDGKYQKRVLRKEIIEVRNPILIFFAGGIKTRVQSLLTYEHVASGFLPRFILVTAESDVTRLRPLGPPTEQSLGQRGTLVKKLQVLRNHYNQIQQVTVNDRTMAAPRTWDARLTPEAWQMYNRIEASMLQTALDTTTADILTPSMDRLAKSGLKASVLIAASRSHAEEVVVQERDLAKAFQYIETWREYTLEVVNGIGKTGNERLTAQIYTLIAKQPGILRSEVMRNYHLTARDADGIFNTLDQRGQINRVRSGRSERLYALGVPNA